MATPNGPSAGFDFSDAPGADMDLDSLFGNPETTVTAPEPDAGTPPAEAAAPQATEPTAPTNPDFFLKSPDGSVVYKTQDEALRGLDEKNRLINELRQRIVETTGVDPVTNRPVQRTQPQAEEPNYAVDYERFYRDAAEANQKHDAKRFAEIQAKFVNDLLAPVVPLVQELAQDRAAKSVAAESPDFMKFKGSPEYKQILEQRPALARGITMSEQNIAFANQLPELYRLAYEAYQVQRMPEIIKAQVEQARSAAPPVQNPQPARPTTTSPSSQPPIPSFGRPDIRTPEGRKAIIDAFEKTSGMDKVF